MGNVVTPNLGPTTPGALGADEDIIPTAIVIKNIPFNVKRETLLDIIVSSFIMRYHRHIAHLFARLLSRSRRLMRSITILTRLVNSGVLPLLTSGSQLMPTPSLLPSMVSTCKAVSCASNTKRFCKLAKRSALSARRLSVVCVPCNWRRSRLRCSSNSTSRRPSTTMVAPQVLASLLRSLRRARSPALRHSRLSRRLKSSFLRCPRFRPLEVIASAVRRFHRPLRRGASSLLLPSST